MARGVVLFSVLFLATAARADEPLTREVSQERFSRGLEFYSSGDFTSALREFEAARQALPLPALDFNIGRCLEKLERWNDAIAAYQRYLRETADAEERAVAERRIEIIRGRLRGEVVEPPNAGPAPRPLVTTPAGEPVPPYKRWWVWSTAAFVVAVGVGIGLGVSLSGGSASPPLRSDLGTIRPF